MPPRPDLPCLTCGAKRDKWSAYCAEHRRQRRRERSQIEREVRDQRKAEIDARATKIQIERESEAEYSRRRYEEAKALEIRKAQLERQAERGATDAVRIMGGNTERPPNVIDMPRADEGLEEEPPNLTAPLEQDIGFTEDQLRNAWRLMVSQMLDLATRDGIRKAPGASTEDPPLPEVSPSTRVQAANAFFRAVEPLKFERSELASAPEIRIEYIEPKAAASSEGDE